MFNQRRLELFITPFSCTKKDDSLTQTCYIHPSNHHSANCTSIGGLDLNNTLSRCELLRDLVKEEGPEAEVAWHVRSGNVEVEVPQSMGPHKGLRAETMGVRVTSVCKLLGLGA